MHHVYAGESAELTQALGRQARLRSKCADTQHKLNRDLHEHKERSKAVGINFKQDNKGACAGNCAHGLKPTTPTRHRVLYDEEDKSMQAPPILSVPMRATEGRPWKQQQSPSDKYMHMLRYRLVFLAPVRGN